ncbi:MAG: protein arginine kinase [Oscillospiraceae bacterium]|jgi:protein arginine kinase|nr:protein arginine kinase [Oscillospiraceae bacterium]
MTGKPWYLQSGDEGEIVLSTRVRLARNLEEYPFPLRLDAAGCRRVCEAVSEALADDECFRMVNMEELSPAMAGSLAEKHLVSPEFAAERANRALLLSKDESVSIMLCEEDHIRLQVLHSGLALREALDAAQKIEGKLSGKLEFARDERIGYLTQCPSNLGTAMRASVMLHLPALTRMRQIPRLAQTVAKLGLTIRGAFGEGSTPAGDFYQLSNQITLGITSDAAIENLGAIAKQLIAQERASQKSLCEDIATRDAVFRALGILQNARILGSREFLQALSLVRMGAAQGLITVPMQTLNEQLIALLPATLNAANAGKLSPEERDVLRAEKAREAFADV